MSQTESSLERSHAGSRFVRYIIERNPVYLVSAMLMFAGIYLAIQPQDQEIGNLKAILATFGALEVYEFLLVGIIVFLVQTRRILDDAAKVFFVEAVCVIACFIILDELAFHAMDSNLSIQWGMLGLTLATLRFGFAGRTVPSRFSWTILVWLFFLFSWNAIAPALMGNSFREFNENREPAWLIAGWALNVLVLFLAPLALMEQRGLRLKERRLLETPAAQWVMLGTVLLTSCIHHLAMSLTLDLTFYLCDLLPSSVFLSVAILCLAPTGPAFTKLKVLVILMPASLAILATITGEYISLKPPHSDTFTLADRLPQNLRILNWPVLWLGVSTAAAWAYSAVTRNARLAHLAVILTSIAAFLIHNTDPHRLELSFKAGGAVVLVYLHALAVSRKSHGLFSAAHIYLFAYMILFVPDKMGPELWLNMLTVFIGITGCSMMSHWLIGREWMPARCSHMGAGMLTSSLLLLNLIPFLDVSTGTLLFSTLLAAFILAAFAWLYGFRGYYVFSSVLVILSPGRPVAESGANTGSSLGWLLILLAFVFLGAGVLVSMAKADEETVTA